MHAPIDHHLWPIPPKRVRVSHSVAAFAPTRLGGEQMLEVSPHTEMGPKPKLSPHGCTTKEEELKSLRAAAQATDLTPMISLVYPTPAEQLKR